MLKLNEDFSFNYLYARSRTDAMIATVDEYLQRGGRYILWLHYDSDVKILSISFVDDDEEIGEIEIQIHNQEDLDRMNAHIIRCHEKVVRDWTEFRDNGVPHAQRNL